MLSRTYLPVRDCPVLAFGGLHEELSLGREKQYSPPKPKILVIFTWLDPKFRYYIVQMLVRRYLSCTAVMATSPDTNYRP